jgi:hypothetical protein
VIKFPWVLLEVASFEWFLNDFSVAEFYWPFRSCFGRSYDLMNCYQLEINIDANARNQFVFLCHIPDEILFLICGSENKHESLVNKRWFLRIQIFDDPWHLLPTFFINQQCDNKQNTEMNESNCRFLNEDEFYWKLQTGDIWFLSNFNQPLYVLQSMYLPTPLYPKKHSFGFSVPKRYS